MNKSDEELELRALRDMLDQAKKDIKTLLEFYDCPRDFDFAMASLVQEIEEQIKPRYKPKGESNDKTD